ncbi:hypothetical protein ACKU27_23480 [Sphingobium yanoikuyae]|uniref:hypothetical protein n=1 Tax=Sphingobium yanoikuyae TaxID=13690 RepID=UPI00259B83B3|nr:hypothetical protein [uncultured Sphingobium sp.]
MRIIYLLPLIMVTGCDKPEIKQCEDHIIRKLRSPSTYKRINASGIETPYQNPKNYTVKITYDAANAYGTPVREEQLCVFGLRDGKPDTTKYYEFDEDFTGKGYTGQDVERAADAALKSAQDAINNASAIR